MKLIQIFLPLADNEGKKFPYSLFNRIKNELVTKFNGITTYTQNPAQGLWEDSGEIQSDQIIIYEVIARSLDTQWWLTFKKDIEVLFKQDEILIRCFTLEVIQENSSEKG